MLHFTNIGPADLYWHPSVDGLCQARRLNIGVPPLSRQDSSQGCMSFSRHEKMNASERRLPYFRIEKQPPFTFPDGDQ